VSDRTPEDYERALKAVVGITMDTLRGESPFEPPPDPEGAQEFVDIMQGVVDEHRQRKRSNTVRRARRSRINKRGF
jgi:hypothetical protein